MAMGSSKISTHFLFSCDILTVRNGSLLITSLSGNQGNVTVQPITAVDDNTVIVIAFSSDLTDSEKGFKAHYDITTSSGKC